MKKLKIIVAFFCLPFLLVWAGFILTAGAFKPYDIFTHGAFWGLSCMYWFLYICLIDVIVEIIDESEKPAK